MARAQRIALAATDRSEMFLQVNQLVAPSLEILRTEPEELAELRGATSTLAAGYGSTDHVRCLHTQPRQCTRTV